MDDPSGVIFDMDGVLIDSYDAHYESWQRLGREVGLAMSEEQFLRSFGRTSREVLAEFWPAMARTGDDVARLDARKEALFREIISKEFPVMDGAVELIDALAAAGLRLAVGSSGPPTNVGLTLDRLERKAAFTGVVTGADVTRGKPHPEVFLIAAERLGVPPRRCVVIEDAPAGIEAAQAAGMRCIGLASTGRDVASLAAADLVVRSLREISVPTVLALIDRRP
jgi:beta-phosphoglucomutase